LDKYLYLWGIFYGIVYICTLFYLQEPCENKENCSVVGWLPFHSHFYKNNYIVMLLFFGMYVITVFGSYFYLFLPYSKSSLVTRDDYFKYPLRVLYPFFVAGMVSLYTIHKFQINLRDVFASMIHISRINDVNHIFSIDKSRMSEVINLYNTFTNPKMLTKFLYYMWVVMSATYGLIILLHT